MCISDGRNTDMYPSKAPFITAEIERRIRHGFYHGKLPSNDTLRNDFLVARQTLTEALRPLFSMGILSCGSARGGILIHPENLMNGVIAVVSGAGSCGDEANLSLAIRQDGFSVLKIRKNGENPFLYGIPEGLRGVLFINSSLDKPTALFLKERKIPFISCNIIPFLPGIPYIDYDNPALYRQLIGTLSEKGYRKISFFKASKLEGYNELAGKEIRRLKREFGFPVAPNDRFTAEPEDSVASSLRKYISLCEKTNAFPEILVSDFNLAGSCSQIFRDAFPDRMFFLYHRWRSSMPPVTKNVFSFYSIEMSWRLWLRGYRLLREIIFGRDPRTIHQLVERKIAFDREIPENSL